MDEPPAIRLKFEKSALLMELDKLSTGLDAAVRARDRREILVAMALMPVFLALAIWMPYPLTRLGALLIVPWCGVVVWRLRRARRQQPPDSDRTVTDYLRHEATFLNDQKKLLRTVWYWYVLPPAIACLLFIWGLPYAWPRTVILSAGVLAVHVFVWLLNREAVRTVIEPAIRKVEAARQELME